MDNGQTDAAALNLPVGVQTLIDTEYPPLVLGTNPDSVVPHKDLGEAVAKESGEAIDSAAGCFSPSFTRAFGEHTFSLPDFTAGLFPAGMLFCLYQYDIATDI